MLSGICAHATASRRDNADGMCNISLNKPASKQNQHTQQQHCRWLLCNAPKLWLTLQMGQRNNNSISYLVCCAPVCTGQLHPTAEKLHPGFTRLPIMLRCMSQQGCFTAPHPYMTSVRNNLTPGTCSIQKQNAPLQVTCSLKNRQTCCLTPSMLAT